MNARSIPVIAAFLTLLLVGALPATAAAGTSYYYLALGDSLARGVQPNTSGAAVETNQGYVDDLYGLYRGEVAGLQLTKLGCPGETTTTMIHGGVCYPAGTSQLDRAVGFLRSHHVVLVTIDIGANNVLPCVGLSGIDTGCINQGVGEVTNDLPYILQQLRAAAGPGVPIVAMNYYDPFLAEWLQGPTGQALAKQSVEFTVFFNNVLAQIYAAARVPVADVQAAFQTTNFTLVPPLGWPLNVSIICASTWMCAPSPVGPNIHPNVAGYWVIAGTFAKTIGVLQRR